MFVLGSRTQTKARFCIQRDCHWLQVLGSLWGDLWYHRQNRQPQHKFHITLRPHRRVSHFQQESDSETEGQTAPESADGKKRAIRKARLFWQIGGIQHAKLLASLRAIQVYRLLGRVALLLQFIEGIKRRLVTASQLLV